MSTDLPPPVPTPVAPAAPALPAVPDGPSAEDRTTGMLCHLVGILAGIIGALIMHLCMTNKSPFVSHHAKESLNFQITLIVIEIGLVMASAILAIVTLGLALFVTVPLIIVVAITFLVLEVLACVAANRGEWHRYPLCIRFVK